MLEILVKFLAIGGPIALAVMGFVVVDKPAQSSTGRIIWYGAFAVVALISVIAAVVDSHEQGRRLTTMLTGGEDNFPEVFGVLQPDQSGSLPLLIANVKGTPLFDVTVAIKKAGTFEAIAVKNWATLLGAAFDTGIRIAPGNYQIDILARNGWFIEMYILGSCKGQIFQYFSITMPTNGGKLLRQSPPNPDLDCLKALGAPLPVAHGLMPRSGRRY
jgi:hypothetical protein